MGCAMKKLLALGIVILSASSCAMMNEIQADQNREDRIPRTSNPQRTTGCLAVGQRTSLGTFSAKISELPAGQSWLIFKTAGQPEELYLCGNWKTGAAPAPAAAAVPAAKPDGL
jgi:hypothetical protein